MLWLKSEKKGDGNYDNPLTKTLTEKKKVEKTQSAREDLKF